MSIIRNRKGQFIKGVRSHSETEFKKGEHWRKRKPFWDKEWLRREYVDKKCSSSEIAKDFNVTENAILFWLNKHDIDRRNMNYYRIKLDKTSKNLSNWCFIHPMSISSNQNSHI